MINYIEIITVCSHVSKLLSFNDHNSMLRDEISTIHWNKQWEFAHMWANPYRLIINIKHDGMKAKNTENLHHFLYVNWQWYYEKIGWDESNDVKNHHWTWYIFGIFCCFSIVFGACCRMWIEIYNFSLCVCGATIKNNRKTTDSTENASRSMMIWKQLCSGTEPIFNIIRFASTYIFMISLSIHM